MASSGSHRSTPNIPTDDDGGHGPAPTSRTSVQKVHGLISELCDFKKFLVEQIGFGGLLRLPNLARLNLRFSKWVMTNIDTENRCIRLDHQRTIKFWAADVHKVFGIPCGQRDIQGLDVVCTNTTIQIIRSTLGMSEKGKPVLKAAEEILKRPLSESSSSSIEKDSFKMAFVIFVVGHVLAPSSKHDHTNIDFWGAIANTEFITDFNWCEYVLQDLFTAVRKLNLDIQNLRPNTHLQGCHLFAQVFYLDNMNLGIFNMRHDVLPRISCFDDVKMRRMILQCSTPAKGVEDWSSAMVRHAEQICYTRSMWDTQADTMTPGLSSIPRPKSRGKCTRQPVPCQPQALPFQLTSVIPLADTPQLQSCIASANDFSNYMKDKYPLLAASQVGIMLKHHNAVGFQIANGIKNQIDQENTRFLDKFVAVMAESCICCSLRSLPCIAQNKCQQAPTLPNLYRQASELSESEGESSYPSKRKKNLEGQGTALDFSDTTPASKIVHHQGPSASTAKEETPNNPLHDQTRSAVCMKTWADTILGGIMMYNEDNDVPADAVVMGQTCAKTPSKLEIKHTHYTKDHWRAGADVEYPSIAVQDKLFLLLPSLAPFYSNRDCITHPTPRYISMPVNSVISQLVGNDLLEHELCSLIFRRLRQIDIGILYKDEEGLHRHLFEADFSTSVIAGEKVWELKSVQEQFVGPGINYNICNCRTFHIPVVLQGGWCVYIWDMVKKTIYIFDPLDFQAADPANKAMHEIVADKLHVALFTCFYKFFSGWHVECINWNKVHPLTSTTNFYKNQTGVCIIHISRHFNSGTLEDQLTDDAIFREKGFLLFHMMSMEGNIAPVPKEIMDFVAST